MLFSAKLQLHAVSDAVGVAECDLFLDRIKIIDLLVANGIRYVPSLLQLSRIDRLRRLRDRLIEDEFYDLAASVSTKCGIDVVGVWLSWGKSLLKCGDYATARVQLAKCLKVSYNSAHTEWLTLTFQGKNVAGSTKQVEEASRFVLVETRTGSCQDHRRQSNVL